MEVIFQLPGFCKLKWRQKLKVGVNSQGKGVDVVKIMVNSPKVKSAAWVAQKVICGEAKKGEAGSRL